MLEMEKYWARVLDPAILGDRRALLPVKRQSVFLNIGGGGRKKNDDFFSSRCVRCTTRLEMELDRNGIIWRR